MYREYPAPEPLAGLVECFWRHELSEPDSDLTGVVLPDGRVDIVWTADGAALLAGPQRRFTARPLRPPFVAVGVRFRPGAGPPLLGVAAHELVDLNVTLEAIDTRAAALMARRLAALEDPARAFGVLGDAVAALADGQCAVDGLVVRAAGLLDRRVTVGGLSEEVALSERQLQRRFRESIGYGPKTLHRILRFQRVLEELVSDRDGSASLAGIAAATGYSDQAHLTRESQELAGLTPVGLRKLWQS
jgi:AraC-like DNA-binding protein